MTVHIDETELQDITSRLYTYFPDCKLTDDLTQLQSGDGGDILYRPEQILPYLQTIFFEEHLVELQCDQSTRIFFSRMVDDLPDPEEHEEENTLIVVEEEYESGSYLKKHESFLLTPLTPPIGNARVRSCQQVVLRFFSGTVAVELGCTFRQQDVVNTIPVLRFDYPLIGRINRNYRPFRVKAVSTVDAYVTLKKEYPPFTAGQEFRFVDVSAMGMAFEVNGSLHPFTVGDMIHFGVQVQGVTNLDICGSIRHISKIRDRHGYKNICGVQFDLETRSLAAEIEKLAAAIQRLQLRELAEKTSGCQGVEFIK